MEHKQVVLTSEERDLNGDTIKNLEKALSEAEVNLRERDAALKEAQDIRHKGLGR